MKIGGDGPLGHPAQTTALSPLTIPPAPHLLFSLSLSAGIISDGDREEALCPSPPYACIYDLQVSFADESSGLHIGLDSLPGMEGN